MHSLRAATLYFALVFAAGFVLGAIRVPFLVPRLGVRWAELLEIPIMVVVTVFAARFVVGRFSVPPKLGIRVKVGAIALTLLVVAELSLVVVLQRQSVAEYIAGRDPVSGAAYLAALILVGLMPAILGARRG